MFQLIFYGRGGQGAKTLATLLAIGVIKSGEYAQSYPEFGPERTGAPVRAYLRVASQKILTREPIRNPDLAVVLDDSLLELEEIRNSLKRSRILLINTSQSVEEIRKKIKGINHSRKIHVLDAKEIVADYGGNIHVTAPLAGRLLKIKELISLEKLKDVYEEKFQGKISEQEIMETQKAMEDGYYKI